VGDIVAADSNNVLNDEQVAQMVHSSFFVFQYLGIFCFGFTQEAGAMALIVVDLDDLSSDNIQSLIDFISKLNSEIQSLNPNLLTDASLAQDFIGFFLFFFE
jgi:hypothetical protein